MPKIRLVGPSQRDYARRSLDAAPKDSLVSITAPNRSREQNDKMWAMLRDVARCKPRGDHYTPDTWKALFMHLLGHQVQFAAGLDGNGPIPVGFRSSHLSVAQMSDLIELIYEWGTRHGVVWNETKRSGFEL